MNSMRHATVDFQIDRHTAGAQFVGVVHALVHQRVTLGQADPRGGHAFHIGRLQGGKPPVLPLRARGGVVAKKTS